MPPWPAVLGEVIPKTLGVHILAQTGAHLPLPTPVHNRREHSPLESSKSVFSLASTSTTPSALSNAFLLVLSFNKEKGCLDGMLHIADVILTGRAHLRTMPVLVRRFDRECTEGSWSLSGLLQFLESSLWRTSGLWSCLSWGHCRKTITLPSSLGPSIYS